ncbi:MAG: PASTA domain-containing protein [Chlorobiaceae bacterium]|nr:PASTA domain-containing protein [Chlorobiaceae bacterium]
MIPVPDLAGVSLSDARAALLEADLRVGQVTSAESRSEPGSVLEQSPEAGAQVRPGSPVALAISARRTVEVPSVVGLELAEARDILERAGLVPVTGAANGQSDEALVVSQSPKPSETATEGTPVMLTLEAVAGTAGEQPPDQTPPWPAIATGATLIALLGGAILYRRSIRAKSAPTGREARVSIRETIDYGTQQVQLTGDPDKPPTIVLTIHPDQGIQEIRQP